MHLIRSLTSEPNPHLLSVVAEMSSKNGGLASPTIQTLNTWTEMLPKAEALVAEVLSIDGGQQNVADQTVAGT